MMAGANLLSRYWRALAVIAIFLPRFTGQQVDRQHYGALVAAASHQTAALHPQHHKRGLRQTTGCANTTLARTRNTTALLPDGTNVIKLISNSVAMVANPPPASGPVQFSFQIIVRPLGDAALGVEYAALTTDYVFRGKGDKLTVTYQLNRPGPESPTSTFTFSPDAFRGQMSTPLQALPFLDSSSALRVVAVNFTSARSTGGVIGGALVEPMQFSPSGCPIINLVPYPEAFNSDLDRVTSINRLSAAPLPVKLTVQNFVTDAFGRYVLPLEVGHDPVAGLTCLRIALPDDPLLTTTPISLTISRGTAQAGKTFQAGEPVLQLCFDPYITGFVPFGSPAAAIRMFVMLAVPTPPEPLPLLISTAFSPFSEVDTGNMRARLQTQSSIPLLVAGREVPINRVGGGAPLGSVVVLYDDTSPGSVCARFAALEQPLSDIALESLVLDRRIRKVLKLSSGVSDEVCFKTTALASQPSNSISGSGQLDLQFSNKVDVAILPIKTTVDILRFTASTAGGQGVSALYGIFYVPCAPGTGGRICAPCPANTFSAGGTIDRPWPGCQPCPSGQGSAPGSTFCRDNQPPIVTVLRLPPNRQFEIFGATPLVRFFWSVIAVDTSLKPLFPFVTCTPASGSFFPISLATPVSCLARDAAGNVGLSNFTVKVNPGFG